MDTPAGLSAGYIAFDVVGIVCIIALPLILGIIVSRRLHVGWRYFWFGALIFFLFQLITRVPVVEVLQVVFSKQLQDSRPLLYGWLAILAITAGLFEEVGRYLGYRWFMGKEEKTWAKGVMYGLGHGGLESMVLVGGLAIIGLINALLLPSIIPSLTGAQHDTAVQALDAIKAQPDWYPLIALWERIWTLTFHVAMSVVVLQVFRRNNIRWLFLAIALHAILDGVSVFAQQLLPFGTIPNTLIIEGFIAAFGLFSLWLIFALRDRGDAVSVSPPAEILVPQA